ncbi:MAG: D-isomer specific 2-hydroxyacid dehydrogenase, NAD-binding protein [Ramlibacter sp.]|jgi:D-3-phosphoglycerate dehydrogenase|uniref:NAD(P)-dependent oxidoreductase n=1 Tax=Ramlibacter sp. TaxID=1917967 RepID=UPI002631F3BB|nr:NAD(P)-dependent oxidoreductase [Ramlibacter sp.]MDB5749799.1 D-isomer specific 2-hydroxyacid dehydrogenase, NAD-binding protein [Ramlibacter sp.]
MKPRVLLTHGESARRNYYGAASLEALQAIAQVRLNPREAPLLGEALVAAARGCSVIISDRQAAAPASLFESLPELAVFQRCAVDVRNIDLAAAGAAGVLVTHASAGFGNAVAEWVLGAMIALARGLGDGVDADRGGLQPAVRMGRELRGATLGIIGYGVIGRRLAEIGQALGMRVLVADPFATVANPAITVLPLDEMLPQADFVVCLAPATAQTGNLMNAQRFAAMQGDAFFVNASRGELVDEAALLQSLQDGHLGGCALDVGRAPDQMPSPALAAHPRVLATPHTGGLTPQAAEHQSRETVAQLAELLAGRMPVGALNPGQARRLHLLPR